MLTFSNNGVDVQDPHMDPLIGTGHKIGWIFDLSSLQLPSHLSTLIATLATSSHLWHSQFGHASFSRVQILASQCHLGSVDFESLDYISCQLGK